MHITSVGFRKGLLYFRFNTFGIGADPHLSGSESIMVVSVTSISSISGVASVSSSIFDGLGKIESFDLHTRNIYDDPTIKNTLVSPSNRIFAHRS